MKQQARQLFYLGVCTVLLAGFFLAGCTGSRPVATNPRLYQQQKIQAVDHWDTIADTVAARVNTIYQKRDDLITKPIYVAAPNDRPFSVAFRDLLKTRLVTRGMQISEEPEPEALILRFDVQAVVHESATPDLSLESMGIGLLRVLSNYYAAASKHELVINTHMSYHNRYVLHLSTPCYINDEEVALYVSPALSGNAASTSKRVRVTGR